MSDRKQVNASASGRVPPHSLEAEVAILGIVLLQPDTISLLSVKQDDFYDEGHQLIFGAIQSLDATHQPVDAISVSNELGKTPNALERAGGILAITELSDRIPTAANIEYYDRIVKGKAQLRGLASASWQTLEDVYGEDIQTGEEGILLDRAEQRVMDVRADDHSTKAVRIGTLTPDYFRRMQQHCDGTAPKGIQTGLADLDNKIGGLRPSQNILIAGRPGMGKTSLGVQIARNAAKQVVTAMFSLEMDKEELYTQILAQESRVNGHALEGRMRLRDTDIAKAFDAAERIQAMKLFIDDDPDLTPSLLRSKCRRIKAQQGSLGLVVVDYVQLMGADVTRRESKTQEVSDLSRSLKILAKELKCPVVALSQLNRDCEKRADKRPMPSDLRDSGALEQDADLLLFVYRDEIYHPDSPDVGTAEVIIGKQRKGELGPVRVGFQKECTLFYDLPSSY